MVQHQGDRGAPHRRQQGIAAGGLFALVVVGALALAAALRHTDRAPVHDCPAGAGQVDALRDAADAPPASVLVPADDRASRPPTIQFGRSRAPRVVPDYKFKLGQGPMPDTSHLSWDLDLVSGGNHEVSPDRTSVRFEAKNGILRVRVCVDPRGTPSGTYVGKLAVVGAGVSPVEVPLRVTLKDRDVTMLMLGLAGASLAGLFYKWYLDVVADESMPSDPDLRTFVRWVVSHWARVAIALAIGPVLVYRTRYAAAAAFEPSDRWGLYAVAFSAIVTASVFTTNGVRPSAAGRHDAAPAPAGPAEPAQQQPVEAPGAVAPPS